jgi:hypothetical protein
VRHRQLELHWFLHHHISPSHGSAPEDDQYPSLYLLGSVLGIHCQLEPPAIPSKNSVVFNAAILPGRIPLSQRVVNFPLLPMAGVVSRTRLKHHKGESLPNGYFNCADNQMSRCPTNRKAWGLFVDLDSSRYFFLEVSHVIPMQRMRRRVGGPFYREFLSSLPRKKVGQRKGGSKAEVSRRW